MAGGRCEELIHKSGSSTSNCIYKIEYEINDRIHKKKQNTKIVIPVLYEDNHIIVCEKQPGVLSQADDTNDPDMLGIIKNDIKKRYNKPGNVYLGLVHRLDRMVGGVMVFAKTSKAASRLSEQIRQKLFEKTYLAIVKGVLPSNRGTLRDYLVKDERQNIVKVVQENDLKRYPQAKLAVLDYEVIKYKGGLSALKINLHTGRPHQIRVQLSNIGCPILGDAKYCGIKNESISLWAYSLKFIHPTLKNELVFQSYPPDVFPWSLF